MGNIPPSPVAPFLLSVRPGGSGSRSPKGVPGYDQPLDVEENAGRLIGHDRESQLGVGRNTWRKAKLATAPNGPPLLRGIPLCESPEGWRQGPIPSIHKSPLRGARIAPPSSDYGAVFRREPIDSVAPMTENHDPAVGAKGRRFHPVREKFRGPLVWLLLP